MAALRYQVGSALLRQRAADGTFYPYRREIEEYACSVDTSRMEPQPDALGLYRVEAQRYLFIEGLFSVSPRPLSRWRGVFSTLC